VLFIDIFLCHPIRPHNMSVKRPPASVLTVPEALRGYFYHDASLLSELMKVGIKCLEDTLSTVLRRPIQGGYIVVVQTNGRSGSYNPHLHIIVTSGGLAPSRRGGQ